MGKHEDGPQLVGHKVVAMVTLVATQRGHELFIYSRIFKNVKVYKLKNRRIYSP